MQDCDNNNLAISNSLPVKSFGCYPQTGNTTIQDQLNLVLQGISVNKEVSSGSECQSHALKKLDEQCFQNENECGSNMDADCYRDDVTSKESFQSIYLQWPFSAPNKRPWRERYYAKESVNEREVRLTKDRLRKKAERKTESDEKRQARLEKQRQRTNANRAANVETEEHRQLRLFKNRLYMRRKRELLTEEEKQFEALQRRLHMRRVRALETPEKRMVRSMKSRLRKRQRIQNETEEQREIRLLKTRLYARQKRAQETEEQREKRLSRNRLIMRQRREKQTDEERRRSRQNYRQTRKKFASDETEFPVLLQSVGLTHIK